MYALSSCIVLMSGDQDRLIGIDDATSMPGIRPPTVRKMLRENKLPVVRFNRRVFFDPAMLSVEVLCRVRLAMSE